MANLVQCPSCHSKLSLGDQFHGRRVKCPRCQQVMEIPDVVAPQGSLASGHASSPSARRESPPPIRRPVAQPVEAAPIEDDYEDRGRRRKKRRRRRRFHHSEDSGGKPAWVWLVLAGGLCIAFLMFAGSVWLAIALDIVVDLVVIAISLAFMVPISAIVLFISMLVSSAVAGGIDFGPLKWAIPKAAVMLILVNLCYMIPLPYIPCFLALGVWIMGWMGLFGLDLWEARLVIVMNWIIMTIIKLFVVGILVSLVQSGRIDIDPAKFDPKAVKEERELKRVQDEMKDEYEAEEHFAELGVTFLRYTRDEEDAGRVKAMLCRGSQVKDADLAKIKYLKKCRSIDLTGTAITDKGLKYLHEAKALYLIGLEDNKVSEAAVKELKKALPNCQINRGVGSQPPPMSPREDP
jgi:hypothetical protein